MGLLATGAGASKGLQTLIENMLAEQEAQRRSRDTDSVIADRAAGQETDKARLGFEGRRVDQGDRGLDYQGQTQARLNTSADIANRGAQLKLDTLRRPTEGDSLPGERIEPAIPGAPPSPTGLRKIEEGGGGGGIENTNNPKGRAMLQVAGLNPNEIHGSVPQRKGPEDYNAEETFYTGLAKRAGYPDYKTWAGEHPQEMAKARHQWAEQAFTPMQSSPPVVLINDPTNPGQTTYSTRGAAIGERGPMPAAQGERTKAYEASIALVKEIEALGDKVGWKGIGPVEGRLKKIGFEYLGVGSPDESQLRDKIGQLKAAASFQEGGKQFTGAEKALLDAFLAGVYQNPTAVRSKLKSFRESAERSHQSLTGTSAPGGGGAYEEYLKRTKPGSGGK